MENEAIGTQDTNAAEGFEDTGFLEGLDGLTESETQEAERDTNAEPPHDPEEGAGEAVSADDTQDADGQEPGGGEPEEAFLEITFCGEQKPLTREEAVSLAQKGMNYDHLDSQVQEIRAERARLEAELSVPRAETSLLPLVRAYAKAAGGDMQTLIAQMTQAVQRAGVPIEQPRTGNYMQEKAAKDWQAFLKAYPDVRDPKTELPKEVWERIGQGVTPINAMIEHRQADLLGQIAERDAKIKEYEQRERTHEQNEKNKKKAVGNLSSTAGSGKEDGFLSGFLG